MVDPSSINMLLSNVNNIDIKSIGIQLVFLVILLALSAFFSSSETALLSYNKIKMRRMVDEGIKGAKTVSKVTEDSGKMLSVILIGNNLVNIGASSIATSLAISIFQSKGVGIATAIMTILIIIFSEITPKTIASQNSESIALKVATPIYLISKILSPIAKLFNIVANALVKLLGGEVNKEEPSITEEELKTIVDVGQEEGVFEQDEKEMIYNVFDFADLHVKDIMVQRIDIKAVDVNTTYDELIEIFETEQFSRMPVYEESIDKVVGIINIKDLFFAKNIEQNFDIRSYMRKPYFTFEYKMADELFKEVSKNRTHMVIVVDEYGGTAGLITLEDLIEEILGEIEDEYDDYEEDIQDIGDGQFLINANTKIEDVNEALNLDLVSKQYDSIGGFMIEELGHIPELNETVKHNDITIKACDIDKNRVLKVKIFKLNTVEQ